MEPVEVVVHADQVDVPERLIVAPVAGVFRPRPDVPAAGSTVETGQTLGAIERLAGEIDVVSPHTGRLMGLLALPGERVRDRQPVAWVRLPEPDRLGGAGRANGAGRPGGAGRANGRGGA